MGRPKGELFIRASKRFAFGDDIRIDIIVYDEKNDKEHIGKLVFDEQESDHTQYIEPTVFVHRRELTVVQVLMDDLWNCGLRPSEGTGSAGAMQAVQGHLKDMRNFAEKLLNKVLEK